MTRQNAAGLPEGLPVRFTDPEAGFTRLCEFLKIANRSEQQGIVNNERVKRAVQPLRTAVRGLPTAKRIRTLLSAFYKLPNERRVLWQHTLKAPAISVGSSRHPVPSFEYQALKGYDSEFLDRNVDEARLDKALLDFPGVSDLPGGTPEWQQPALAIWPDLRRDLIEWDTLDSDRRDVVVLALFAIATILDDSRFLHWAADRVDSLADEFKFAHAADAGELEQGAMRSEESNTDETGPAEHIGELGYLGRGRHEFDVAPQPRLIQPVRRGALGDEGADQDVGIKNDPHARRPPPRRSGRGCPVGHPAHCDP